MANVYMIQPSFTTGEISPAVGSRVDLEKYRSALLNAENTVIRPYGGCYRRQGSQYIGELKYSDKDAVLVSFADSVADAYLLEVGYQYIRIWHNNVMEQELSTPFTEPMKLQFTQSGDIMFICSGDYPVKELQHTDVGWNLVNMEITEPYYDILADASIGMTYGTEGVHTYEIPKAGAYTITIAGAGGGGGGGARRDGYTGGNGGNGAVWSGTYTYNAGAVVTVNIGAGGTGGTGSTHPFEPGTNGGDGGTTTFQDSASHSASAAGGGGGVGGSWSAVGANGTSRGNGGAGGVGGRGDDDGGGNGANGANGYAVISFNGNKSMKPSATSGENVTITSTSNAFAAGMEGGYIRLTHSMPNKTVSLSFHEENATKTSESLYVGENWKIVTHGTHHSEIHLQKSKDNKTWEDYRTYTSNDDQNYTESGSETEGCWMRVTATMWNDDEADNSKLTVDLSRLPYEHEGTARITQVLSGTQVRCVVTKDFGSTEETETYAFSSWNDYYGYPKVSGFFQDRFCLAATDKNPYSIWMSRTGDYPNFSVEKVDGTATDDSAVKLDLIVRNFYEIRHMIPSNDLVILTSGNEWIIPGDTVITPGKCNPKAQTMRGSSACLPQHIGNRVVYVQRSGSTVRDLGYNYESDNYNGDDLGILATHLIKNHSLISSAYCQEPDSNLYFVRDDGVLLCFTLIREQQVFAWSHFVTDGKYKWVAAIPHDENDELYAIVERTVNGQPKRYIERFHTMTDETDEFLDSYVAGSGNTLNLSHLSGKTVAILGDGIEQQRKTVPADGILQLDETYDRVIAGLPYTTKIEQPSMEINLSEGTLQGRVHKINAVTLRLENSYGGHIGLNFKDMDELKYDAEYELFTGDLTQSVPLFDVGANTRNHLCIQSDAPYPFRLNAIIREVSVDGGMVRSYNGPAGY